MEGSNTPSPVVNPPAFAGPGVVRKLYNPATIKTPAPPVNLGGRPSKLTDETVNKLIAAFQRGHSDTKACEYAKISRVTYYKHFKEDPEFANKITDAKNLLTLQAADNIMGFLTSQNPKHDKTKANLSKWWLEKKEPEEFGKAEVVPTETTNNNNYLFISHDQLREYIKAKNITALDPIAIVESLTDSDVGRGNPEANAVDVYQETIPSGDSTLSSLSAS